MRRQTHGVNAVAAAKEMPLAAASLPGNGKRGTAAAEFGVGASSGKWCLNGLYLPFFVSQLISNFNVYD